LAALLGLKEDATEEAVLGAIGELKKNAHQDVTQTKEYTDLNGKLATLSVDLKTAQDDLGKERRARKVSEYAETTRSWSAISGTPDELAEKIVSIEEIDPASAWTLAVTYQEADQTRKAAGLTKPLGVTGEGPAKHEFTLAVEEAMKTDPKLELNEAWNKVAREQPEKFASFRKVEK
jgi:hypothetical protein